MKILIFSLMSGILFSFSMPPYNFEALGWPALLPLLVAARGRRPLEAMGLGIVAGLFCGIAQVGWHHDTARLFWAYMPFLWLAILFGIVTLAAEAARARGWTGLRWSLFVAGTGVAVEWLSTFSPLPLNIALCQYLNTPLIQIAALTGIWGVSFLLWWANAALADAVLQKRPATLAMGVGLALVLLSLAYGRREVQTPAAETPPLRVAAIQDFTGDETTDLAQPDGGNVNPGDRDAMTRRAAAQGAQLIVWSEECLGSAFLPQSSRDPTTLLARQLKTHLIVGYSDSTLPKPFNCAAIVTPQGQVVGVHHKIHLYLGERQAVQPGHETQAFGTALGKVGLEVCFDTLYTGVTRGVARSGAQIVAMPNFDPPTPHGVLHRLHGAMLPFRAVENHVPFVRADSNGLSQVIDARGRILGQSPLWAADILMRDVPLGDGRGTLFTRWGDWFAYLCTVSVVFLILSRKFYRT